MKIENGLTLSDDGKLICPSCGDTCHLHAKQEAGFHKYAYRCDTKRCRFKIHGTATHAENRMFPPDGAMSIEQLDGHPFDEMPGLRDPYLFGHTQPCPSCGHERMRIRATRTDWSDDDEQIYTTRARCACGHESGSCYYFAHKHHDLPLSWEDGALAAINNHE